MIDFEFVNKVAKEALDRIGRPEALHKIEFCQTIKKYEDSYFALTIHNAPTSPGIWVVAFSDKLWRTEGTWFREQAVIHEVAHAVMGMDRNFRSLPGRVDVVSHGLRSHGRVWAEYYMAMGGDPKEVKRCRTIPEGYDPQTDTYYKNGLEFEKVTEYGVTFFRQKEIVLNVVNPEVLNDPDFDSGV